MGKAVCEAAKSHGGFEIVAGVDIAPVQAEFPIYSGISEVSTDLGADVIIDFSHHSALEGILTYCQASGCAAVICTTGHTDEEKAMMRSASEKTAVFYSRNMSLGINLLLSLVRKAAATLEGFDIVREVDHPCVKVVYDIYHQQVSEGNIIPNMTKNLDCIAHLHSAGHPGRHELQYGESDYHVILKAADGAGYKGACGLEYGPLLEPVESLKTFRKLYGDLL